MRVTAFGLSAFLFVLCALVPARAQVWKLSGAPEFVELVNDRAIQVGETRTHDDGEGGVTTTLVARTVTSAEFIASQPRYGTHHMSYSWDAPPDIIRSGELISVGMRWQYAGKWKRFCPQMTTLCHLDWSDDWYTALAYGELAGAPSLLGDSGGVRNSSIKVADNDSGVLNFYWRVMCGGAWVQVAWKYKRVAGDNGQSAAPVPPQARAVFTPIFKLDTVAGVHGNPARKTVFTLQRSTLITGILTYHWNDGQGATPGTIGLRKLTGESVGTWNAVARQGAPSSTGWPIQNNPPYYYWTVRPESILGPGTYEVVDSDRASWSTNDETKGMGVTWVFGEDR